MTRHMGLEYTNILMELDMKEIGRRTSNKDKGLRRGQMEQSMKVSMKKD